MYLHCDIHIVIHQLPCPFFVNAVGIPLAKHAKRWKTLYTESTFWFDAHHAVFAVLLVVTVLLVANGIWKYSLMKQERALIKAGEEARV